MDLDYGFIFNKINELESMLVGDIELGKIKIADIPEILITQKIILNAIAFEKGDISNIPVLKLDSIVCLAACQFQNSNLLLIPPERAAWVSANLKEPFLRIIGEQYKTPFICETFVVLDYKNINYIPDSLLSDRSYLKKLCFINPMILSLLSLDAYDPELCDLAMQSPNFSLNCIPIAWRSKEICLEVFDKNYKELLRFPTDFISLSLVKKALQLCSNGEVKHIIRLLPVEYFDSDLIVKAVKKDEDAFNVVPFEQITPELVFELAPYFKKYESLFHIPEDIFTVSICHRLISCNPLLLFGIPVKFKTKDLCMEAIVANGLALGAVPSNLKSDLIYRTAVMNNGLALKYVPTPYRDSEIPLLAIEQNGEAIEFVPESVVDEVLCRKAVLQNPHAIYYIPKKLHSNELYLIALKQLPSVLKLIPVDMRTVEHCLIAIQVDKSMYEFVPTQLRDNPRLIQAAESVGLLN